MAIQIISASAGSGKTYRLAEILEEAVVSGEVRPDAIVATTFTKKAAAELTKRVRTRLLKAGRPEDAERLAASRIGTVNSVCGGLVGEFAFELGLPPRMEVLSEAVVGAAFDEAMSGVMTLEQHAELAALKYRFGNLDWRNVVGEIVNQAGANGIKARDIPAMAGKSAASMLSLLGKPLKDGKAVDRALGEALEAFIKDVDTDVDTTKKTARALAEAERLLAAMKRDRGLKWSDWANLASLEVARKSEPLAELLHAAASKHDCHPGLHDDIKRTMTLLFAIASTALLSYQNHKLMRGVIDFTDQEVLALKVLGRKDARERLKGRLDLVLVDEFQDTSPIQLAIFLKLAELAQRSVWVGDQKQSIYGFRGADPKLMDAAIEHVLGGDEPETLTKSWRSRPELVRVTSAVFAPAFDAVGIPASRVMLEPAHKDEPSGLGTSFEHWVLDSTNIPNDAKALAAAARKFLADPKSKIRDPRTRKARRATAGDIAILCKTNKMCVSVADALESLGISAVIARTGLLATAEAQTVLAGLKLWADPRDRLAQAQLARVLHYADSADEWLKRVLEKPGKAFAELPEIRQIARARDRHPNAGAVVALERVIDDLGLREYCLRWGNSEQRLANLDALRAYAVGYSDLGESNTPAGLVAFLSDLDDDGAQSSLARADAVTVSTWHSSKGLEWPVTVLFQLYKTFWDPSLGVYAASDSADIDMTDPLAGRWIRYWFKPYGGNTRGIPFFKRLKDHPITKAATETEEKQLLRLLYVGWTRARDKVVLASRADDLTRGMLERLHDANGLLVEEPKGNKATWAGKSVKIKTRSAAPEDPVERKATGGEGYVPKGPKTHPPAFIAPSDLSESAVAGEVEKIGKRMTLTGKPDMTSVGQAVHGFFAADRPELDENERLEIASGLAKRWGVGGAFKAEEVVRSAEAFRNWIETRWPKAVMHKEWPLTLRTQAGSVLRGIADLVLELDEGFVIIDHKSFPGGEDAAVEHAASFGGQLAAYAECVRKATGKKHLGSFVHLPVSGMVVPLGEAARQ